MTLYIYPGDLAIVDRSLPVKNYAVILARVDEEFTLKRYRRRGTKIWLQPENPTYKDIHITEDTSFEVWGVIHKTIRMLAPK